MLRRKKEWIPSKNFCVICGRHTNDKKLSADSWGNQFFICHNCKKVWCGTCMGQVLGIGPSKANRQGKKGKISCPDCGNFVAMARLPKNLPFAQSKPQEMTSISSGEAIHKNFCKFCGEGIPENATYCNICGAKQE